MNTGDGYFDKLGKVNKQLNHFKSVTEALDNATRIQLEVENLTLNMHERAKSEDQPFEGKSAVFYDPGTKEFYFLTFREYTAAVFHGVWQTCYKFNVGHQPEGADCLELMVTLNHPDLKWLPMHPDTLPAMIDLSLDMNDEESFVQYSDYLLDWEEDLMAIGGELKGYNLPA